MACRVAGGGGGGGGGVSSAASSRWRGRRPIGAQWGRPIPRGGFPATPTPSSSDELSLATGARTDSPNGLPQFSPLPPLLSSNSDERGQRRSPRRSRARVPATATARTEWGVRSDGWSFSYRPRTRARMMRRRSFPSSRRWRRWMPPMTAAMRCGEKSPPSRRKYSLERRRRRWMPPMTAEARSGERSPSSGRSVPPPVRVTKASSWGRSPPSNRRWWARPRLR
ncbi:hypothetical protein DAI22_11g209600 [Oryza sativa Japonica Group]|nr:hypothetical protein DAI22_11g209600 [Oryza sativa Japonica Group]